MSSCDNSESCSDSDSSGNYYGLLDEESSDRCDFDINLPIDSLIDKNGTLWDIEAPVSTRTPAENILYNRFGVSPIIKQNINSMVDTFRIFINQQIYDIIIKYTNQSGSHIYGDKWIQLDKIELDAFIGCLLLMGVHKDNQEPLKELFNPEEGRKIYRDLFSLNRFRQIMRTLHFDNIETREIRKAADKFCHIREIWGIWIDLLASSFRPYEDICIDEQLVAFWGRCKFKQYMPMKPAKYGIKFFLLVDPLSTYVSNICVYLGKCNDEAVRATNVGKEIVLHLIEPFHGLGRNLVCDNFFTSVELADELLTKQNYNGGNRAI